LHGFQCRQDGRGVCSKAKPSTGFQEYAVSIDFTDETAKGHCTCPSGQRDPVCKHVLALLLWRAREMESLSAGRSTQHFCSLMLSWRPEMVCSAHGAHRMHTGNDFRSAGLVCRRLADCCRCCWRRWSLSISRPRHQWTVCSCFGGCHGGTGGVYTSVRGAAACHNGKEAPGILSTPQART
jgi:SWIM zinc finger